MQQPVPQFSALKRQAVISQAQSRLSARHRRDGLEAVRPVVLAMPLITLAAVLLATGLAIPF